MADMYICLYKILPVKDTHIRSRRGYQSHILRCCNVSHNVTHLGRCQLRLTSQLSLLHTPRSHHHPLRPRSTNSCFQIHAWFCLFILPMWPHPSTGRPGSIPLNFTNRCTTTPPPATHLSLIPNLVLRAARDTVCSSPAVCIFPRGQAPDTSSYCTQLTYAFTPRPTWYYTWILFSNPSHSHVYQNPVPRCLLRICVCLRNILYIHDIRMVHHAIWVYTTSFGIQHFAITRHSFTPFKWTNPLAEFIVTWCTMNVEVSQHKQYYTGISAQTYLSSACLPADYIHTVFAYSSSHIASYFVQSA